MTFDRDRYEELLGLSLDGEATEAEERELEEMLAADEELAAEATEEREIAGLLREVGSRKAPAGLGAAVLAELGPPAAAIVEPIAPRRGMRGKLLGFAAAAVVVGGAGMAYMLADRNQEQPTAAMRLAKSSAMAETSAPASRFAAADADYDATNGTVSSGDIYRMKEEVAAPASAASMPAGSSVESTRTGHYGASLDLKPTESREDVGSLMGAPAAAQKPAVANSPEPASAAPAAPASAKSGAVDAEAATHHFYADMDVKSTATLGDSAEAPESPAKAPDLPAAKPAELAAAASAPEPAVDAFAPAAAEKQEDWQYKAKREATKELGFVPAGGGPRDGSQVASVSEPEQDRKAAIKSRGRELFGSVRGLAPSEPTVATAAAADTELPARQQVDKILQQNGAQVVLDTPYEEAANGYMDNGQLAEQGRLKDTRFVVAEIGNEAKKTDKTLQLGLDRALLAYDQKSGGKAQNEVRLNFADDAATSGPAPEKMMSNAAIGGTITARPAGYLFTTNSREQAFGKPSDEGRRQRDAGKPHEYRVYEYPTRDAARKALDAMRHGAEKPPPGARLDLAEFTKVGESFRLIVPVFELTTTPTPRGS